MRTTRQVFIRGDRIRALREARGWTQTELHHKSGISQAHLSNIENGNVTKIGTGVLDRLSRALRTNMAYLTGARSDPLPWDKAKLGELGFDEAELLTNYRTLKTKQARAILRQVAEGLVRAEKEGS